MFTCHKYHVAEPCRPGADYAPRKFSLYLYRLFGLPVYWSRKPHRG